jgi:hypothetical protein
MTTLAGFRGGFIGRYDCAPTEQEIWDAAYQAGFAAAQLAAPVAPAEARCKSCGGNDADMPCAYPGEGRPGCLRDARLAGEPKQEPKEQDERE